MLAHVLAPIHPKAMPVILRNEAEFEGWLDGVGSTWRSPYSGRCPMMSS